MYSEPISVTSKSQTQTSMRKLLLFFNGKITTNMNLF